MTHVAGCRCFTAKLDRIVNLSALVNLQSSLSLRGDVVLGKVCERMRGLNVEAWQLVYRLNLGAREGGYAGW